MNIKKGKQNVLLAYLNGVLGLLYFAVAFLIFFGLFDKRDSKGIDLTIMMFLSAFFCIASLWCYKGFGTINFSSKSPPNNQINQLRNKSMYSYGEIGYEPEAQFGSLQDTLGAAVSHSVDMGSNPIGVSDDNEQLLYVIIEGEVFKKTTEE